MTFFVFAGWSKQFQMSSNVYSVINIDWSSVKNSMKLKTLVPYNSYFVHHLDCKSDLPSYCHRVKWRQPDSDKTHHSQCWPPIFISDYEKKKRSRPSIDCNNTVKIIQQHVIWMHWTASPLARKKKHELDGRKDKPISIVTKR
jgi:hypothetical protein